MNADTAVLFAATGEAPEGLEGAVFAALDRVIDPCSNSWQRPLSIVDLGLVRRISVDTRQVARIEISLTTAFCLAISVIMQAIEERVGAVPGITDVEVSVDPTVVWSMDLMTEEGRERLLAHRRRDVERNECNTNPKEATPTGPVVLPMPSANRT
jgi:metal-sulfur cluster biosynthetic enzyme